jgi:putative membrane protein
MIRTPMLAIGLAAAFALAATAAQAQSNTMPNATGTPAQSGAAMHKTASKADQKFLKDAIQGDLAEVQAGKLAQQKGQADDVKKFGETLEQDHSANLQKAQSLAQQMGVTPPTEPNANQKNVYDKLNKASDARFDRELKQAMIKDHKKDIADFQKHAKGKGEVVDFAQQTLPTLKKHLQMAQSLGKSPATTGSR